MSTILTFGSLALNTDIEIKLIEYFLVIGNKNFNRNSKKNSLLNLLQNFVSNMYNREVTLTLFSLCGLDARNATEMVLVNFSYRPTPIEALLILQ